MKNMLKGLWVDEAGFVVSTELILIATILVIALTVGMTTVRDHVIQELGDVAEAISNINQSYSYSSVTGHSSSVAGSIYADLLDFCDAASDQATAEPGCIDISGVAADPE